MCRRRIRVPDQWYGDYLSQLGAARIGERRLKALAAKHGVGRVRRFIDAWFDYAERRADHAIRRLPRGTLVNSGLHDPVQPFLPESLEITVKVEIDPTQGRIAVDLRDNPDCIDAGLNLTEACATANCIQGVFENLEIRHPAQRRQLPPPRGQAARGLRRRHPALPAQLLAGDHQHGGRGGEPRAVGLHPARRRPRPGPGQSLLLGRHGRGLRQGLGAAAGPSTSTRSI